MYFLVILVSIFVVFIFSISFGKIYQISTQPSAQEPLPTQIPSPTSTLTILEKNITEILNNKQGDYGIYFKDLKSEKTFVLNADREFQTASLYKLWVMAETYRQIKQGKLDKEHVMTAKIAELNEQFKIATESADPSKDMDDEVSYTVFDALNEMITISGNYSAFILGRQIRLFNVSDLLESYKLNHSSIGDNAIGIPTTTARDTGVFFELLYKGELIDEKSSIAMLELLKKQQLNDKIPRHLPEDIEIAHKTGELAPFNHDAGIVYTDNGNYIIAILSETDDQTHAEEVIANISKTVYDYVVDEY
ncbi:hypothetical protein A3A93_03845 [Candidatus Roizmanbacteria bacterium RIFCSPLOWO2_01_FULL_38_12]|uniref:Beta-lactamase class A catalytic domain-containing protein n=1 Tax=Candidatus Roizmanbacteria bacterium RIFCSPLOWO2_01_FULL_38_12 TaxID=1802061 RepID=A0A1F7IYX4_9BACT|nr:MAG: hypothetical protein A2861_04185 [Candidatus Roizmanbacteria bacterium RIFCSPHIGHO2_01_FULL_38_15]OGK34946.1 MAG: hypothetical protein A3F59_03795 [Candidatus Roizmanbacteria bacterium RIFCSPHIGHO2_12_FULL_38_13]OGK48572.1 MAG: hypothetical protein A3A93_03845 [Candidatus Roizmanbacteria bacterium RIFCSPLOWO2_01_FULL_38_12]